MAKLKSLSLHIEVAKSLDNSDSGCSGNLATASSKVVRTFTNSCFSIKVLTAKICSIISVRSYSHFFASSKVYVSPKPVRKTLLATKSNGLTCLIAVCFSFKDSLFTLISSHLLC